MLITRKKDEQIGYIDAVSEIGITDYIKDGKLYENSSIRSVLVESSSDLSLLEQYGPGTVAYTVGWQSIWQKGLDGTWTSVI